MEFAMLPPEVNSGRMYAGPGPGPMLAAATAWDGLAADLGSAAASYESVIAELAGGWLGPASTSMAAAAAPYAAWMHATAAQAAQVATQAKGAAAAYEAAFAMTVPPPVVAANRAQLATLVATNLLGQNTAAIAATEAHYTEMWAQDATAMYGYAGSSAAASALTPFTPPGQATNAGGVANQAAAVAQATGSAAGTRAPTAISSISAVPQALQSLASPAASAPVGALAPAASADPAVSLAAAGLGADLFGALVVDSAGSFGIDSAGSFGVDSAGVAVALQAAQIETKGVFPGFSPFPGWGTPVSAGMGQAASVGGMSVPQSWTVAAPPAIRQVAMVSPETTAAAASAVAAGESEIPYAEMAAAGMAGRALGSTAGLRRREPAASTSRKRAESPRRPLDGPITGIAAELRELADLRDSEILTEEEFTQQKQRLLGQ